MPLSDFRWKKRCNDTSIGLNFIRKEVAVVVKEIRVVFVNDFFCCSFWKCNCSVQSKEVVVEVPGCGVRNFDGR